MSLRDYGWYLASFVALIVSGTFIGVAGFTLFESQTPMYISIVCSILAIGLAVVAWLRYPKGDRP